ncbi:hypothetical protein H0N99_00395 [Candidatus Micrarchaeota archaeon]|nr:hypothetical protein [Candidatus Micrarchaeota archaeon]
MRKGQLFSQDIIFAMLLVLFIFALWLNLRERVLNVITASDDRRQLDEAAFSATSQLLESSGVPSNWDKLSNIDDTTVSSIGIVSDRNNLDPGKTAVFVSMANNGGDNYTILKKLLGLNRESYRFNFTISSLNGTSIYSVNYTPSGTYNASYAATNTTAFVERFALLNNSVVKVTLGVWIE